MPHGKREAKGVSTVLHYSSAFAGLVATVVVLFLVYPGLSHMVAPLEALSSTALVAIGVGSWAILWFVLELVVELRGW